MTLPACCYEQIPGLRRLCIIAGDISPIDVITHLPILCEDKDIPYVYVPSKEVSLMAYTFLTWKLSQITSTTTKSSISGIKPVVSHELSNPEILGLESSYPVCPSLIILASAL